MRSGATRDRETRVRITGWVAPKFSSLERNLNLAEYKNPQQEPGGDRRMLMVFAVTFALIIISQIFLFKDKGKQRQSRIQSKPRRAAPPTPAAQPQSEVASAPSEASPKGRAHGAPSRPRLPQLRSLPAAKSKPSSRTRLFRIVFTNRGAQVKSWVLKKYKDEDGHPLDLVNPLAVKFGLPLSLYTYDENLRNQINSALYVGSASRHNYRSGHADL